MMMIIVVIIIIIMTTPMKMILMERTFNLIQSFINMIITIIIVASIIIINLYDYYMHQYPDHQIMISQKELKNIKKKMFFLYSYYINIIFLKYCEICLNSIKKDQGK